MTAPRALRSRFAGWLRMRCLRRSTRTMPRHTAASLITATTIVATTLLYLLAALAFAERRLLVTLLIGLALTGLTFVVFNYGLGLSLPTGSVLERLLPAEDEAPE